MAGLYASLRPQPPSSSSSSQQSFLSKVLLLLTILPLSLAVFAFFLQWRGGGVDDPISRWSPEESHKFPGMDSSPLATVSHSSQSSDCSVLAHANTPSFPYYKDWKFKIHLDLKPKVRFFSLFLVWLACGVYEFWLISNGFCWTSLFSWLGEFLQIFLSFLHLLPPSSNWVALN